MAPLEKADGEMNFMRAVITPMRDKLHLKCLLDILLKISNRWLPSRQQDIWGEVWLGIQTGKSLGLEMANYTAYIHVEK